MKWYKRDPDAFATGVACLSLEEVGAYSLVIDAYYARDGYLPDDDWLIARILNCNPRTWRKIKLSLFQKRKLTVNSGGSIVPNRGEYTLNEARTFSELQTNRVRKRWKTQQDQSPADTMPVIPKQPQPQPQPQPQLSKKEEDSAEKKTKGRKQEPYAFESGVIRLTASGLEKWRAAFPHLSVEGELVGMASWAAEQQDWFCAVSGLLAKRNREIHTKRLNGHAAPDSVTDFQARWKANAEKQLKEREELEAIRARKSN